MAYRSRQGGGDRSGLLASAAAWSSPWLLRSSPAHWWLFAAVVFTVVLVLLARFAPVLLLPLFYDVRPLEREELRERLIALAERPERRCWASSSGASAIARRKANAALVGIGRTRRILRVRHAARRAFRRGDRDGVRARARAPRLRRHLVGAGARSRARRRSGCYVADYVLATFAVTVGLEGKADVAGLPLLAACARARSRWRSTPMTNALSRAHERRADRYALETTKNSAAFISAMKRLAVDQPRRGATVAIRRAFFPHSPLDTGADRSCERSLGAWSRRAEAESRA